MVFRHFNFDLLNLKCATFNSHFQPTSAEVLRAKHVSPFLHMQTAFVLIQSSKYPKCFHHSFHP